MSDVSVPYVCCKSRSRCCIYCNDYTRMLISVLLPLDAICITTNCVVIEVWFATFVQKGVCFKCFSCLKRILQVFYMDVVYVAQAIHVCCKCIFQMFQLFRMYVASVLSGCCICCTGYTRMLQVYVLNVSAISNVCCKYFIWILHML
jgi:hypothetical protein